MELWWDYERGGLIQHRPLLRSAWDIVIPPLRRLRVGRVESYWESEDSARVLWRTLDHWLCDFREGYRTRDQATKELVAECPRATELIRQRREYLGRAT